ncbi:MAG: aspartate kinase [Planctomycetes bacterium SM23_25]|nr:MAG: aspartate kinase [Planctomycetes bacterium SM23_25]
MADADQFRKVCEIITSDPERRLIVVSAPGRRHAGDTKVTDLLIACAEARLAGGAAEEELGAVVARYAEIARDLRLAGDLPDRIAADLKSRLAGRTDDRGHFLDTLKAAGEDNCAKLMAECLRAAGAEARYVSPRDAGLVVSDEFGNARVLAESYARLAHLADAPGITVFPGFFGYSPAGEVVTFPRGGSDITGAILAAAVKADVYENFTDVDSVLVTNPDVVPGARPLPELTYREMRELSYAGFGVFHEEALEPVFHAGVPVHIKNTNNPSAPGTQIVFERHYPLGQVAGIAAAAGFCSIYVSKYLMNREVGFGRRLLEIIEDEGLSYEHTPSGIDNISVILREAQFDAATEARVVDRIRRELDVDDVSVERGLALVMIVGECMRHVVGVAARACGVFAKAGVNIEMINQGSSEVSMMFGVTADDSAAAVRALYDEFFETGD